MNTITPGPGPICLNVHLFVELYQHLFCESYSKVVAYGVVKGPSISVVVRKKIATQVAVRIAREAWTESSSAIVKGWVRGRQRRRGFLVHFCLCCYGLCLLRERVQCLQTGYGVDVIGVAWYQSTIIAAGDSSKYMCSSNETLLVYSL